MIDKITSWAGILFMRVQHERVEQWTKWRSFECGFTGNGATLLDKKPGFPKPWIPKFIVDRLEPYWDFEKQRRKDAWRQSCINTLGEDPNDW